MNFEPQDFPGNTMFPLAEQMGHYMQNAQIASVLNGQLLPPGIKPLMPYCNVDIQPSANCPRKFIIVDQTRNGRLITFKPEINPNFVNPGFGVQPASAHENIDQNNATSSFKEDSDDIDALLSTDCGENQERDDDDDVVSTARTGSHHNCSSPESYSNYETTPTAKKSFSRKRVEDRCNDKKRRRIRKMVKALKGIVPGADHMSTVSVLDEAVRYLKTLKVELQKLGVENARN